MADEHERGGAPVLPRSSGEIRPSRIRPFASLAAALGLAAVLAGCTTSSCTRLPGLPVHHVEGGFCNPPGSPERTAGWPSVLADRLRMMGARYNGPIPVDHLVPPAQAVSALHEPRSRDTITWLGHGTVLLRLNGRTILVDPIWAKYVTPIPPLGPKRIAPPPVPLEALPPIDVLLLTHNHYDHLDLETLRRLPGRERIEVVAPLALGPLLREAGLTRVRELDWWQSVRIDGMRVWLLPAQHQSGRGLFDRNKTLWASYALMAEGRGGPRVYLSGDSGYHTHFREIGQRLGPFDLAVMNVGGYGPLPVAEAFHFTPEDAARAVQDLRARRTVPVHWGTYPLGSEPIFESGPRFVRAAAQQGSGPKARLLAIGETWGFGSGRAGRDELRARKNGSPPRAPSS